MSIKSERKRAERIHKHAAEQRLLALAWDFMSDGSGEPDETPGGGSITIRAVLMAKLRLVLSDRVIMIEPPCAAERRPIRVVSPDRATEEEWAIHRQWKETWTKALHDQNIPSDVIARYIDS